MRTFTEEQVREIIILFSKIYPEIEDEVFTEFYDANNCSPTEDEANVLFDETWEKAFKKSIENT